MAPSCSATHHLTGHAIPPHCRVKCANISFVVDSVACAPIDDTNDCEVSYFVHRTNADSTTDVISGAVKVASGGCDAVDLRCADDTTCIHSKLQLCCE